MTEMLGPIEVILRKENQITIKKPLCDLWRLKEGDHLLVLLRKKVEVEAKKP